MSELEALTSRLSALGDTQIGAYQYVHLDTPNSIRLLKIIE